MIKLDHAEQPHRSDTAAQFQTFLDQLYQKYRSLTDGKVANYIPELAKMNPDWFGIAVATIDGQIFTAGDADQLFTIQSISKVFVQGLALEDHGRDYFLTRVGVEPTGDAFNAIVLDEQSKRPYNPMVNAGAIATTSLIKGTNPTDRLNRLLEMFRRYIGHDLHVDMSTFMSERTTGNRNRAMAYLMANFGMIDARIEEASGSVFPAVFGDGDLPGFGCDGSNFGELGRESDYGRSGGCSGLCSRYSQRHVHLRDV